MSTQQHVMFAETIRGMKLAMRRRDTDSDSDESITQPTNRGNKLKRNASNVREGRLDTTGGRSYKRQINHAGYQRYIVQPNPVRYDDDGDIIDDELDEEEGYTSPTEDDPWGGTRLEELLAPLTNAGDLSHHPSLSVPFTAKALTEMAQNARDSLHRERQILWHVKQLLLRFRGDDPWVPVGKLETNHDVLLLDPNAISTTTQSITNETDHSINESAMSVDGRTIAITDQPESAFVSNGLLSTASAHDTTSNGIKSSDMAFKGQKDGFVKEDVTMQETAAEPPNTTLTSSVKEVPTADHALPERDEASQNGIAASGQEDHDMEDTQPVDPASPADDSSAQIQHRMTTRARARTPTSPDLDDSPEPSPAPSSIPPVHGFFHVPSLAMPDRDFGLPTSEAEDTRRLLILFVQKQDQVVREAEQIFERLMKADRMRKEVYQWSKAEAHVGDMSDGEDWYDKEEWNLEADLIKGKEEEEVEEEGRGKGRRGGRRGAQH